jgi:hypothetical protein
LQRIAGKHVASAPVLAPMLIRQSVKIEMSVSATAVDFREQFLSAFLQDLIEPSFSLRLLARIIMA